MMRDREGGSEETRDVEIALGSLVSVPPVHFGRSQITRIPSSCQCQREHASNHALAARPNRRQLSLLVAEFS
jgi:hypothetical protein